ncbi:hypothetical protein CKO29_09195 [Allochromatium vinosum]|nr:hypothetical protein [Allochromatium vinosum]
MFDDQASSKPVAGVKLKRPAAPVSPSVTPPPHVQPAPPRPAVNAHSSPRATASKRPASNQPMQAPPSLKPYRDPDIDRNVIEVTQDGAVYRIPARLGPDGRYEVTDVLSVGGFGVVYQGRDRRLFDKPVLIKAIRYNRRPLRIPNNLAVLKEVEAQRKRLDHERKMLLAGYRRGIGGIPILLDVVQDLGLDLYGPHTDDQGERHYYNLDDQWRAEPYLILSFVTGTPMSKVSDQDRFNRNRLGNTKQVILQVGRMLAAFHDEEERQGRRISFIYQDLKPDNIIFTREKQPVLIDFGGFAFRVDGQTQLPFARTGTPGYQPPEFLDGTTIDRLDARADVFSLGMTVYHLLGGVAPRADAQGYSVCDPAILSRFPPPWRAWIEQATRADRHQRFASMKQAIAQAYPLPSKATP